MADKLSVADALAGLLPPPAPLDPFDPDVLHSLRQGFVAQTGTKRRVNLTNRTSRMNGRSSTEEDGD